MRGALSCSASRSASRRCLPILATLALFATLHLTLFAAALPEDPDTNTVSGTWTWAFTMPDGTIVHPKLKLSQDGDTFKGISSVSPGTETPIDEGQIKGDQISFEVVRERDGQKTITRYRGTLGVGLITGKIESNWTGEFQTYDWEAHRPLLPSETLFYSDLVLPDGQKQRWRFKFKLENERLLGRASSGSRKPLELRAAKLDPGSGELSFQVEREKDGAKTPYQFNGRLRGNVIRGRAQVKLDGKDLTLPWAAHRPKLTVDGTWEWTHAGNQDRILQLERRGDKLTGKFITDEQHEYDITEGRIKDNEIYFEVRRERDGVSTLTRFKGKVLEDTLTGTIEFLANEDATPQTTTWEAKKAE